MSWTREAVVRTLVTSVAAGLVVSGLLWMISEVTENSENYSWSPANWREGLLFLAATVAVYDGIVAGIGALWLRGLHESEPDLRGRLKAGLAVGIFCGLLLGGFGFVGDILGPQRATDPSWLRWEGTVAGVVAGLAGPILAFGLGVRHRRAEAAASSSA